MAFEYSDFDDPKKFLKYPLAEIKTPHDGDTVWLDRYWVVTPDEHVLFFRGRSAQCNTCLHIMDSMMKRYPRCRMELVPVSYIPASYYT